MSVMNPWLKAWELVRDVGLTGYGAWIIYRQVYSMSVSIPLIILGGALMVPAARANILALLVHATGESSSSSLPPPEPPSAASSHQGEATGE